MSRRRGLTSISLAQVMAFIGLILAGYFIVGFARVAVMAHQLKNEKAQLQAEVAAIDRDIAELEAKKEYVQSDEYVERAAREELKMSREGDQVFAPVFETSENKSDLSQAELREPAAPVSKEPWQAWFELLFD